MSSTQPDRALERLLAELRAQRPPEPQGAVLPERLRAELRSFVEQPRSAIRRGRAAGWQLGAALALAAAALLALNVALPERTGPPARSAASALVEGEVLALGVPIEAGAAPRSVQHPERATWLLEPGSRARLLASAPVLRVDLERGQLRADVRPSSRPETFVVQARGTEVAVHGTRFSVSLQGERVRVQVLEGSVLVRPVGQSAGTILRENMQADFVSGALLPAPAPVERAAVPSQASAATKPGPHVASGQPGADPRAPVRSFAPRSPSAGAAAAAALPPEPLAPAQQDSASQEALRLVTEHVRACFRRHQPGSSELGVELSTRLGLWVQPSGQLLRADFEPPLAPAIESCVARELGQFRAAPSEQGYRVEQDLLLQR